MVFKKGKQQKYFNIVKTFEVNYKISNTSNNKPFDNF